MTKKELIKALEPFDGNMQIMIESLQGEFQYAVVENIEIKNIRFSDDEDDVDGDFTCYVDCLVIKE